MDFKGLATDITVFLTPFFPYLILASEATIKEVGKRFGEAAWEKAKAMWSKIEKPNLSGVAKALAEDPNDEDFQITLAKLLVKRLEASPELATELMDMIQGDKAVQVILVEHGSEVKNIHQRLAKTGRQETTVRGSRVGDVIQEQ